MKYHLMILKDDKIKADYFITEEQYRGILDLLGDKDPELEGG